MNHMKKIILSILFLFFVTNSWSSEHSNHKLASLIKQSQENIKDSSRAFFYMNKAMKEASNKKSGAELAEVLLAKANLLIEYGQYDHVIRLYDRAIVIYDSLGRKNKIPNLLMESGRIHYEFGDYKSAMKRYLQGLKMYEQLGIQEEDRAWLLSYIGSVFKHEENYPKALAYYEKALNMFRLFHDFDGMSSCYNNIGIIYGLRDKTAIEQHYYEKALSVLEEHNLTSRRSIILDNLGMVFRKQKKYDKALEYFDKSANFILNQHPLDYTLLAINTRNRADVYIEQGELTKAKEFLSKAENYALKSDKKQKDNLVDIYDSFSELYEKQGDYKLALVYQRKYTDLENTLNGTNIAAEIERLQFIHQQEKYAEKVASDKKWQAEKYRVQRSWLIVSIVGFVGILIFSLIISIQKRKLSMAYHDLFYKNIELIASPIIRYENDRFENPDIDSESDFAKYSGSALDEQQKEELLKGIIYYIETEKLFMDDAISVVKLAELLDTNKSYISQIINEKLNKNFNTFINEYRVKEARKMLVDEKYKYLTIEAISKSTGFNSISAFNNAFKKFTGLTPSYFIKSVQQQVNEEKNR